MDENAIGQSLSICHDASSRSGTDSAQVRASVTLGKYMETDQLWPMPMQSQPSDVYVNSCPLTKPDSGLSQLHLADDTMIAQLTDHGV